MQASGLVNRVIESLEGHAVDDVDFGVLLLALALFLA
jgi:hypothetical protein